MRIFFPNMEYTEYLGDVLRKLSDESIVNKNSKHVKQQNQAIDFVESVLIPRLKISARNGFYTETFYFGSKIYETYVNNAFIAKICNMEWIKSEHHPNDKKPTESFVLFDWKLVQSVETRWF